MKVLYLKNSALLGCQHDDFYSRPLGPIVCVHVGPTCTVQVATATVQLQVFMQLQVVCQQKNRHTNRLFKTHN